MDTPEKWNRPERIIQLENLLAEKNLQIEELRNKARELEQKVLALEEELGTNLTAD